MEIASQMLIFASVVEKGSISAAARQMGQTPSAVSKQISVLEDQVRYRLLNRTRNGVLPTQEGQAFYEKCRDMAEKYHEAKALVFNLDGIPRGKLRIASSVAFGKSQLIPALPKFMEEYPEIEVSLDVTDRDVDLQSEGFDAAICFAEQYQRPDIMLRRIMKSHRVLCAAPDYIARNGMPHSFDDLEAHNCLRISGKNSRNSWRTTPNACDDRFVAQGSFEGNSTDVIYRATLAGLGIARLPRYMADQKFLSGELVHVMPEYAPPSTDIAVIFADRRNLAPKIRVFVDFLVRNFRQSPELKATGT
ncbi:LysR family transcriptional regulator [Planktotalea sp.]|uniref:LysR family transcriptional regulator n=1 Tax=Planktotalea sp. TaxID=2029877 RepID=UPI0032981823